MKTCHACHQELDDNVSECPYCSTSISDKTKPKAWGYEYKSKAHLWGIPLLHICFLYHRKCLPIPARGIIAIGQFGIGIINISQIGIGFLSLAQITLAFYALAQVAVAYSLIAQVGIYVGSGYGQVARHISEFYVRGELDPAEQYHYQPPENLEDQLDVDDLTSVNMDSAPIERIMNDITRGKYRRVDSILILKDNKLVFEEYFQGYKQRWDSPDYHGVKVKWDHKTPHTIMSATKSITSAMIGIAIDKGFIKNVHQSIFDYPARSRSSQKSGKRAYHHRKSSHHAIGLTVERVVIFLQQQIESGRRHLVPGQRSHLVYFGEAVNR